MDAKTQRLIRRLDAVGLTGFAVNIAAFGVVLATGSFIPVVVSILAAGVTWGAFASSDGLKKDAWKARIESEIAELRATRGEPE